MRVRVFGSYGGLRKVVKRLDEKVVMVGNNKICKKRSLFSHSRDRGLICNRGELSNGKGTVRITGLRIGIGVVDRFRMPRKYGSNLRCTKFERTNSVEVYLKERRLKDGENRKRWTIIAKYIDCSWSIIIFGSI